MIRRSSQTGGATFDASFHMAMLSDQRRLDRFKRAIAQTVKPGDVVLDLGTGTGILAYLAAKQGAGLVYAVETIEAMSEIAERNFRHSPDSDRLKLIRRDAEQLNAGNATDIPEPVDVITCEMLNNWLIGEPQVPVMNQVLKSNLLKPGGSVVPRRVVNVATLVRVQVEFCGSYVPVAHYETDDVPPAGVLSESCLVNTIDLTIPNELQIKVEGQLRAVAAGEANAIRLDSYAELADGISVGRTRSLFGSDLVPLEEPIRVQIGGVVRFGLEYEQGGGWDKVHAYILGRRSDALHFVPKDQGGLAWIHHNLRDPTRQTLYGAVERAARAAGPQAVVLDIGTGVGNLALIAAPFVNKVYAVENDQSFLAISKHAFESSAYAERIELCEVGLLEDFEPPEQVDVLVCDFMSTGLLTQPQVHYANHFRRFLKPQGKIVPLLATNVVSLAWVNYEFEGMEFKYPFWEALTPDTPRAMTLTEHCTLNFVDLTAPVPSTVNASARLRATGSGRVNAVRLETSAQLDEEHVISESTTILCPMVFPLLDPLDVRVGEVLQVSVAYRHPADLREIPQDLMVEVTNAG